MSHHIYQTEGIVLERRPTGEAGHNCSIFTKELGLVYGEARGARNLGSKLRYSLQDLSHSKISLVRGRSVWRVTGADLIENFNSSFREEREKLKLCARVFSLLKRLVHGEEKNEQLFIVISEAITFLKKQNLSTDEFICFESILLVRILHNLGYIGDSSSLAPFSKTYLWNNDEILKSLEVKREMITAINHALRESHL